MTFFDYSYVLKKINRQTSDTSLRIRVLRFVEETHTIGGMSIGERIRKLRRERNWTQEELGKRVGIPATNIARYENDKNLPRKAMMQRLAEAFSLAVEDLETDRVLPDFCQADPELTVLFRDIASMSEADRTALKRILTMVVRQSRIQQMIAS